MLNANNSAQLLSQGAEQGVQQAAMLARLKSVKGGRQMTGAQIDMVAKDFETMFLSQVIGSMFGESTGASMFGNSETKEIYKTLMMNEYGKTISKAGGIGIASHVKQELLRMQEV